MNELIKKYKTVSLLLFNTIVLFLVLNITAWLYLKSTHQDENLNEIYNLINYKAYSYGEVENQLDSSSVVKMIDEYFMFLKNGSKEYEYHPATEYQLANFKLDFVTIEKQNDGFNIRTPRINKGKNAPKKIYCFGGSTTFGSFIKDEETWPYYLQKYFSDSVEVLNYGVPGFVPTQETNQFIYLLKSGYRPSLCIFMDGVNIGPPYDGSDFSRSIYQKFEENNLNKNTFSEFIQDFAIIKLLQNKPLEEPLDIFRADNIDFAQIATSDSLNKMIAQRFITNALIRKKIAELYDVEIIQFLQPNTAYSYPEKFMTNRMKENFKSEHTIRYNKNMQQIYDTILQSNCGYIDLNYLFNSYNKPAIVDFIHYSPGFNKFLSQNIIREITKDSILLQDFKVYPKLRTGNNFEIEDY